MLYVPHLLVAIYLCLCLFFFLCARASLLSICPPFLFLLLERLSLFIDRFQRSCFLFILSTDQIMEQFSSIFPSQLLISCWAVAHFSAFQAYFHQTVFLTFWWSHFLFFFFFWEATPEKPGAQEYWLFLQNTQQRRTEGLPPSKYKKEENYKQF